MKTIALHGIAAYQRFVSPRKGFCCAYRVRTGRASCSVLGYRAIRRHGVWAGVAVLRRRFSRCAEAATALRAPPRAAGFQDGFCDLSALECVGDVVTGMACWDDAEYCAGGCGWPDLLAARKGAKAGRDAVRPGGADESSASDRPAEEPRTDAVPAQIT